MYVNTLDTYLCIYFCAKNTPFPPEKDHSGLESRLEILISERLISVQSQILQNVRDENKTHL
jgi:hypothetical protein